MEDEAKYHHPNKTCIWERIASPKSWLKVIQIKQKAPRRNAWSWFFLSMVAMPNWISAAVFKTLFTRVCVQENNAAEVTAEVISSTVSKEYISLTQTTLQTIPTCRAKRWRWPLCRTVLHPYALSHGPPGNGQPQSRTMKHHSFRVKMGTTKQALFLLRSMNVIQTQWQS